MKSFKYLYVFVLPLFFIVTACNSTIYDIVEVEEPVNEPITTNTDSTLITENNNSEIKPDLQQDNIITENKFSDKKVVTQKYTVQLGAFEKEKNAVSFYNSAKNDLPENIYYKEFNGLYKVRVGAETDKVGAQELLLKVQNYGYYDSFIVELTYFQTGDK